MKKLMMILAAALILTSSVFTAFGARPGKFALGSAEGKPGSEVTVYLTVSDNPGFVATRLFIGYDATRVKLLSATDSALFGAGKSTFGKDMSANPYTVIFEDSLSSVNHKENGKLAALKFKILDKAPAGKAVLTLNVDTTSTFDVNLSSVMFEVSNGAINVKGADTTAKSGDGTVKSCSHSKTAWKTLSAPTCTLSGQKQKVCSDCGAVLATEPIQATGHKLSEWKVRTPATEKENGTQYRKCSVCGYEEIKGIPKLSGTASKNEKTTPTTNTSKSEKTTETAKQPTTVKESKPAETTKAVKTTETTKKTAATTVKNTEALKTNDAPTGVATTANTKKENKETSKAAETSAAETAPENKNSETAVKPEKAAEEKTSSEKEEINSENASEDETASAVDTIGAVDPTDVTEKAETETVEESGEKIGKGAITAIIAVAAVLCAAVIVFIIIKKRK
ncbi:MAG: hypothetical protein K6F09_00275 [Clostridiales bacterium]|nr:hypothetical protein [Clostridiales bacterium]